MIKIWVVVTFNGKGPDQSRWTATRHRAISMLAVLPIGSVIRWSRSKNDLVTPHQSTLGQYEAIEYTGSLFCRSTETVEIEETMTLPEFITMAESHGWQSFGWH